MGASAPASDAATEPTAQSTSNSNTEPTTAPTPEAASTVVPVDYGGDDLETNLVEEDVSQITLAGDAIVFDGRGATVSGSSIIITSAGTYAITGTLDDGQVIVDTVDEETVRLVLNGVSIASSSSAPIYVANADKVVITLADGTENTVTDSEAYVLADAGTDEPNATIFSHDDLTINGTGSLTVHGNY
ncbi:MAG: carbohydrate-binding domain-containing protein, partial [Anaerolineae bacterium]|nr:carbohydrate-binding domain-containing protein [Anaerolineae bacterium]